MGIYQSQKREARIKIEKAQYFVLSDGEIATISYLLFFFKLVESDG